MILERLFGKVGSVVFIILVVIAIGYIFARYLKQRDDNTYYNSNAKSKGKKVVNVYENEYKFVCQRCGNEWYMSKKEMRKAKAAKREIFSMKCSRFSTLSVKKHHDLTTKIAILDSIANYEKCPNCGSVNIETYYE